MNNCRESFLINTDGKILWKISKLYLTIYKKDNAVQWTEAHFRNARWLSIWKSTNAIIKIERKNIIILIDSMQQHHFTKSNTHSDKKKTKPRTRTYLSWESIFLKILQSHGNIYVFSLKSVMRPDLFLNYFYPKLCQGFQPMQWRKKVIIMGRK